MWLFLLQFPVWFDSELSIKRPKTRQNAAFEQKSIKFSGERPQTHPYGEETPLPTPYLLWPATLATPPCPLGKCCECPAPCSVAISYHSSSEGGTAFSSVCLGVCVSVCLSINTITSEPLDISSRNFQGIIKRSKGQRSSKIIRK